MACQYGEKRLARAMLDKHDELVPSDPRHNIVGPHSFFQAAADLGQHQIARRMTKLVIDGLEPIEIEIEDADVLRMPHQSLFKPRQQRRAVQQTCERIVTR